MSISAEAQALIEKANDLHRQAIRNENWARNSCGGFAAEYRTEAERLRKEASEIWKQIRAMS